MISDDGVCVEENGAPHQVTETKCQEVKVKPSRVNRLGPNKW